MSAAPNYIYLWFGDGTGHFPVSSAHPVNPVRLTPSRNFYQVAVADLNGDAIPDLILSDGYVLSVQLGKGDGSFGAETHLLAGQGINSISTGDVNGDGKADLVLANGGAVLANPVANLETLAANAEVNTGGVTVLLNQTVAPRVVTRGTVTASPEPSTYGSSFTLTATLAAASGLAAPTGSVSFTIDGAAAGTAFLAGGVATLNVSASLYASLAAGTHALVAVYAGDTDYAPLTVAGTHVVLQTTALKLLLCVDAPGSSFPCGVPLSATPLLSPVTMYFGQVLDGTAVESSSSLTGTIAFVANNAVFCTITASVQGGANACPPTAGDFQAGLFTVQATYSGDANNAPAQSNTIQVRVFPDLTTASVTPSVQTAVVGTPITFAARVAGNFAVPGGPVQFLDGTTLIGLGTLNAAGSASFTTSSLAVGTHVVSIAYAGNSNFLPAVSAGVTVVITAPGAPPPAGPQSFTLSVTPSPITLGVGRTGNLQVTVTAVNGFSQPVALTCSGLPNETGCTFINATIAPGGGSTTLQFTTAAPHNCGDASHPYFLGENHSPGATRTMWAGLVLFAAGLFRVRRGSRRAGLMVLLAGTLVGLSMMSGCGNCTDLGTKPGGYTFTVIASAQGGPVSQSASQVVPVTMTIP